MTQCFLRGIHQIFNTREFSFFSNCSSTCLSCLSVGIYQTLRDFHREYLNWERPAIILELAETSPIIRFSPASIRVNPWSSASTFTKSVGLRMGFRPGIMPLFMSVLVENFQTKSWILYLFFSLKKTCFSSILSSSATYSTIWSSAPFYCPAGCPDCLATDGRRAASGSTYRQSGVVERRTDSNVLGKRQKAGGRWLDTVYFRRRLEYVRLELAHGESLFLDDYF